jgi:hypothetical protein
MESPAAHSTLLVKSFLELGKAADWRIAARGGNVLVALIRVTDARRFFAAWESGTT